jgi:hypothetical protein
MKARAHATLGEPYSFHINDNKHAYAGQLNSFTHLRALLALHDRGIFFSGVFGACMS